jgi:epoxyqueuosine reductase
MNNEQVIKQLAHDLGADLCGIASVERFDQAPAGFRPCDVFPDARSVVVVAKRVPEGPFHAASVMPYTVACNVAIMQVTRLVVSLSDAIERHVGGRAVPIPSDPNEYWDAERSESRGMLSLKHAGWLAGLGVITANTLLTNDRYGNRTSLGAVLLDIELKGDDIVDYSFDCETCRRCIDICPVHAIRDGTVNQQTCRDRYHSKTARGHLVYVCNACRRLCPHGAGRRQ